MTKLFIILSIFLLNSNLILLYNFSNYLVTGKIVETRLAVDESGRARGYAYVEFVNATVVQEALVALKGVELIGRKMRLDYSDDSARIEKRVTDQPQRYISIL